MRQPRFRLPCQTENRCGGVNGEPTTNPNGILTRSPGLRSRRYPGSMNEIEANPIGVGAVANPTNRGRNPVGVGDRFEPLTQGSPADGATLGWRAKSPWDFRIAPCAWTWDS